jgi:hypothetical protein
MRQPNPKAVHGPETATLDDVDGLNDIFATSFTDRYRRDGMAGVRVPRLNADIWRYAIEDAAAGALLWRDSTGDIIAFNMVHRSGTEGWMGPLAVRPERQSEGLGKRIVFAPGYLTITVVRDIARRQRPPGQLLSSLGERRAAVIEDCRRLAGELARGVDYTREIDLTARLGIGDTSIVTREGQVGGYALWHSAPLAEARPRDELRVLKVVARDLDAFEQLLVDVQARCHANRMRRISLRCQSQYVDAYRIALDHGFHTHWTDLRMTLHSHGEIHPETGVLFSNWEI